MDIKRFFEKFKKLLYDFTLYHPGFLIKFDTSFRKIRKVQWNDYSVIRTVNEGYYRKAYS